jgi:acetyl-CoA carboxylase biotin carboxyl carrier protein
VSELPLSPDDVAEIVAILDGSPYERLEIRTARFALKVAREAGGWTQEWDWQAAPDAAAAPVTATAPAVDADAIVAPLPGTFYRAPQPGAPPFVEIGDAVEAETVVGIVETMKLMNPVHAGRVGTVAAILVDNAAAVDAGAPLMRLA